MYCYDVVDILIGDEYDVFGFEVGDFVGVG